MTSSARTRPAAVLVLQACLAGGLTGCLTNDRHFFDPQDSRVREQSISVIEPCVPGALEDLGVTVSSRDEEKGKVSFHATSASGLEVLVQLEAMTNTKTQLAVWVYGHSNFGDWLASEIADAIENAVDKVTEGASQKGADGQR